MEYVVEARSGLNGRVAPEPDAKVGTVRPDGDRIVGDLDGDWVAGDDGLFYRAEFVTELTDDSDRRPEDDPDGC